MNINNFIRGGCPLRLIIGLTHSTLFTWITENYELPKPKQNTTNE
jgi:hypothetical protein